MSENTENGDEDLNLPDFSEEDAGDGEPIDDGALTTSFDDDEEKIAADLQPVFDVPVYISAVLGKTMLDVRDLLHMSRGSVLELDRKVGEAIDIYVNNRLVARGEVVVVDDRLGVTMTEIIKGGAAA